MIFSHNLYHAQETPKVVYFYFFDENTSFILFGVIVIHWHNSFLDDGRSLGIL